MSKQAPRHTLNMRNPLVWLRRIRKRCGYGVHSPFAFELLTQVIYSPGRYYAYDRLDRLFSRSERLLRPRRRAVDRLLFRLANAWQPATFATLGASQRALEHLASGCGSARCVLLGYEPVDLLYVARGGGEADLEWVAPGGVVVVDHLRANRPLWQALLRDERFTVTFDLHDVGLAIHRPDLLPDHYIVNW